MSAHTLKGIVIYSFTTFSLDEWLRVEFWHYGNMGWCVSPFYTSSPNQCVFGWCPAVKVTWNYWKLVAGTAEPSWDRCLLNRDGVTTSWSTNRIWKSYLEVSVMDWIRVKRIVISINQKSQAVRYFENNMLLISDESWVTKNSFLSFCFLVSFENLKIFLVNHFFTGITETFLLEIFSFFSNKECLLYYRKKLAI